MPRTVTIKSLPEAFAVIKEMRGQDYEWGEDYRTAGRAALAEILEGQMALRVDRHLEEMAQRGQADRRNGAYSRWLLTELGRIELSVPRTRHFSPHPVVRAYARRTDHIDRMVLACFVLGLSTRKLAKALLPVLTVESAFCNRIPPGAAVGSTPGESRILTRNGQSTMRSPLFKVIKCRLIPLLQCRITLPRGRGG